MSSSPGRDLSRRIDSLIDEFVARRYGDNPLVAEDLVDANPDIAEDLAQRLAVAERVLQISHQHDDETRDRRAGATFAATVARDREASSEVTLDAPLSASRLGPFIAGYDIIREIHRGGQGVVYRAIQDSTQREVAVKVMREGPFASPADKARFDREVHILGQLNHSNIVTIHDSGIASGCHYFVMDYISGQPLDEHIAGGARAINETLRLFVSICEAVNAAHLRGILHRDLKPGNIRLGENGEPYILDFGLAKMAATDVETSMMTKTGQFVGSLPWASPEQAEGAPGKIDLRTDVYSLGVILYQMLTGRFPYEVVGTMQDVRDRILKTEPTRPATIRKQINNEVETIVLKCLSKDCERRYQTAGDLARDIRRYLAGDPIEAKRDSQWYVLTKTLRRHRLLVSVAAAFVLLVTASAVALTILYRKADREAVRARQEAAKAVEIRQFLTGMLASVDPDMSKGPDVTVRQVLEEASRRIETELADRPLVSASVRATIGNTYRALGLYDAAEPHLRAALDTRRALLGGAHSDVASSLQDLGMLLSARGRYEDAAQLYEQALAIRRDVLGNEREAVAECLNNLGFVKKSTGELEAAERLYREALTVARGALGTDHPTVATYLSNLSVLLKQRGSYADAEQLCREALDMRRTLLGDEHLDVAGSRNNLAIILYLRGDANGAETLMREALASYRLLLEENHPTIADLTSNLAGLVNARGDAKGAEQFYRDALAIYRNTLDEDHPRVIRALNGLAMALKNMGDYDQAEPILREALERGRRRLGGSHVYVAKTLNNLGELLRAKHDVAEAEPMYREALGVYRAALGDAHPEVATCLSNLAALLYGREDFAGAAPLYREALLIRENALPEDHPLTAAAASALGGCLTRLGRYADAEPLLLESYATLSSPDDARPEQVTPALERIISLYQAWNKPAKAADYRAVLHSYDEARTTQPAEITTSG